MEDLLYRLQSPADVAVGDVVWITIGGRPSGPHPVVAIGGRTPEHLVLSWQGVMFEHYFADCHRRG